MNISDKIIIKEYESGLSAKAIAKKYKVSDSGIKYRLKKNNILIRKQSYCWKKFNVNFFDKIDSREKAYWLGFLYADGYNCQKINKVVLAIHSKDIEALEQYKKDLEFEGKIVLNKKLDGTGTVMASVGVTSENFSKQLAQKGCFQKKSLKTRMPDESIVPKNLIWHFIRGIFDGDGSIFGEKNATASICGGGKFIDELCEFLGTFNIKTHIYRQKRTRYCNISSIIDVIMFCELIYKDSENCRLNRKYERFIKFKQYLLNRYSTFKQLMINIGLENGKVDWSNTKREDASEIFEFGSRVGGYITRNSKEKLDKLEEKI